MASTSARVVASSGLTEAEKAQVLRNQIAFLEGEIDDKEWAVGLLLRDNEEIAFLASVSERERQKSEFLFRTNEDRIRQLREEIAEARAEARHLADVLAERFGPGRGAAGDAPAP